MSWSKEEIKQQDDELDSLQSRLYGGVEIKDRKYLLKNYQKCFVGREAVNWLLKNEKSINTRQEATELGELLLKANYIYHVTNDHDFKDDNLYYRFAKDMQFHGNKLQNINTNKFWSWSDVVPGRFLRKSSKINLQTGMIEINSKKKSDETELKSEENNDKNDNTNNKNNNNNDNNDKLDSIESFGVKPLNNEYNQTLLDNVHPVKWKNPTPDPKKPYTLVAIGAGAAGLVSCCGAAGLGGKVAIIEKHLFGGDCLNTGCVPSKALLKVAKMVYNIKKKSQDFGININTENVTVDFKKVINRVRKVRAKISYHDACLKFTKKYCMDVYLGEGKFISQNCIQVGNEKLKFVRAVIATGGSPFVPRIQGINDIEYLTSHNLWNLQELPNTLIVIGSGPIGCEMTQSFALLGSKVYVLDIATKILPREDQNAADILKKSMEECGVQFILECMIDQVEKGKNNIKLTYRLKSDEKTKKTLECSHILVATGRRPNVTNLGLEKAGVKYDKRKGIIVNDYLQSSNSKIYACGDCCSRYQFTHIADAQARIVVRNALFFGRSKVSDLIVPWCTYTLPEIAHVGLYEKDCKQRNIQYNVYKVDLDEHDRAICDSTNGGFIKIICKKNTDEILGGTIVSENAGDQISEITLAIQGNIGLGFIGGVIHPYPTISEGIKHCGDQFNRTKLTPITKSLLRKIVNSRR